MSDVWDVYYDLIWTLPIVFPKIQDSGREFKETNLYTSIYIFNLPYFERPQIVVIHLYKKMVEHQ